MLRLKVKEILLRKQFAGENPANMTQLAAAIRVSPKHLYWLLDSGRPQDVERIARGLGVDPSQLNGD